MAKRTVKKMKVTKNKSVEVKTLVLKPTDVAEVILPPGHVPGLVSDQARRKVEIVPVPAARKRTWWQSIFGD